MTVFVESILSIRKDATGEADDWRVGIIQWPYRDLEPIKAVLVKKGLDAKTEGEPPLYLEVLMSDRESAFITMLQGSEQVRRFAETALKHKRRVLLTRFPSFMDDIESRGPVGAVHYEVEVEVAEDTLSAIAALGAQEALSG